MLREVEESEHAVAGGWRMRAAAWIMMLFFLAGTAEGKSGTSFLRDLVVTAADTEDAICFFCSIRLTGEFDGDLIAIGGRIEIEGNASGDAVAIGGRVRLAPGAKYNGDVVAVCGNLELGAGSGVTGDVDSLPWCYVPGQRDVLWRGAAVLAGFQAVFTGLFLLVLRKRRTENTAAMMGRRPIVSLVIGAVFLGLTIFLFGWLESWFGRWEEVWFWTLLGVTLVIVGLGMPGLSTWVGRKLRVQRVLVAVLVGAVVIVGLALVPLLGFVAYWGGWALAAGGAMVSGVGSRGEGGAQELKS